VIPLHVLDLVRHCGRTATIMQPVQ
jgi:hypothetical protein